MKVERQKILVTGASGFVGREVINELANTVNCEIYGLFGKTSIIKDGERTAPENFFPVDIANYETLKRAGNAFKNIGTVVHTAGLAHQFGRVRKEDFWNVNVQGTENVCRLAFETGARHFVLISSVAVYGDYRAAEIDESFECRPEGFYAESKRESEIRASEFCAAHGMKLTILRPSTVIGEDDRGNTARLIRLIDKKRFFWIGNGENKKSLIYKTDVARGIVKTLGANREQGTEIYNLTAEAVSMKEIVSLLASRLDCQTSQLKLPEKLIRGFFRVNRTPFSNAYSRRFEKTLEKWLSDDLFSGDKFNRRFDFQPETTITEALARQVDYYLKRRA